MAKKWNVDQVVALAPDAASRKAGRGLAASPRWSQLGSNESLVWGRFQGSAKEPYQVTVDLTEPAFRCSCPSRKVPCKHGLGLLLMWAQADRSDRSMGEMGDMGEMPDRWASQQPSQQGSHQASGPGRPGLGRRDPPPDPEAQAKRLAAKMATMSAGMDDFERWLADIARQGLAATRRQPFAFWDNAAARLVDAQLPGLADRVRTAAGAVHVRTDWADHLLAELGRWYLAVQAWRRLVAGGLDDSLAADLRVMIGWARPAREVLEHGERQQDRWTVVGRRLGGDERLQSQRTWLAGERSGEIVVLLDFAAAGAALPVAEVVGTIVEAELALYPGGGVRRAVMLGHHPVIGTAASLPAPTSFSQALDRMSEAVARNPWTQRWPLALANGLAVMEDNSTGSIIDQDHHAVRLAAEADPWPLLALTGGRPADLFGELEDGAFRPTTVAVDNRLVSL